MRGPRGGVLAAAEHLAVHVSVRVCLSVWSPRCGEMNGVGVRVGVCSTDLKRWHPRSGPTVPKKKKKGRGDGELLRGTSPFFSCVCTVIGTGYGVRTEGCRQSRKGGPA